MLKPFFLVALLALSVGTLAQSQQTHNGSPKFTGISKSSPTQNSANPNPSQTQQSAPPQPPVVAQALPATPNDAEAQEREADEKEHLNIQRKAADAENRTAISTDKLATITAALVSATERLANYTVGLIIVGGLSSVLLGGQIFMFWKQLGYMKTGLVDTGIAAKASESSAKTAEKSLSVSQRAFVFVKGFRNYPTSSQMNPDGSLRIVEFWRVHPVIENSGKTPTKRMTAMLSATLRDTELPDNFDFPDTLFPAAASPPKLSRNLIGPGVQIDGPPFILSLGDVQAVQNGTKHFYIWGWIDYNDVFEGTPRHRTEFCHELLVNLNPANTHNTGGLVLSMHDRHNGADEDCYRQPQPYVTPA